MRHHERPLGGADEDAGNDFPDENFKGDEGRDEELIKGAEFPFAGDRLGGDDEAGEHGEGGDEARGYCTSSRGYLD